MTATWQSRTIDDSGGYGGADRWRATDEDKVIISGLTEEQANKYLAGELDYCDGCMELTAPFCGDHCGDCEAYCRKTYGACADCHGTAHTWSDDTKPRCIKHDKEKFPRQRQYQDPPTEYSAAEWAEMNDPHRRES